MNIVNKSATNTSANSSSKIWFFIAFFWLVLISLAFYLLLFNNRSTFSHDDLSWVCSDGMCNVSFVVINHSDRPQNPTYSLLLMRNVSFTAYSFMRFGTGKSHRKEIILKKEDTTYLSPSQAKKIVVKISVEEQPSYIGLSLSKR